MGWLFKKGVKAGVPWIDYKEAEVTAPELVFVFKIENYLSFILYEICIKYDCVAISGNAQLPITAIVQVTSTQNLFIPKKIPVQLFSSPCENFNLGILDEEAQGMRLIPITINYPCGIGDTITVTVYDAPLRNTVGCMIFGRKYGGEENI